MKTYEDHYMEKLEQGNIYQDKIAKILFEYGILVIPYSSKKNQYNKGESFSGVEIKNDNMIKLYGNIYIEIKEKSNPQNPIYVPSGIFRDDNTWLFAIGDDERIFIFSKEQLKYFYSLKIFKEKENLTKTSIGMLMPVHEVMEKNYAVKIIELDH